MKEKKSPKIKDSFLFNKEVTNWKINIKRYIFTSIANLVSIKTF